MTATAYESFRQLNNNNYVDGGEKEKSILQTMEDFYNQYISQTQAFWNEARVDQRFLAGDQTLWNELYSNISYNRRRQFNFNRIRPIVNMVGGYQRRNRKATVIQPIEGSDEETANQFSDVISWAYQQDNVYNTISDAFENGGLVTGFSLLNLWLDYSNDPVSGDIKVDHLAYNSFMMDTFFRKQDLSDCSFIWKRKWVTKDEAKLLLPERANEIERMKFPRYGNKDQKFYFMPENYNYTTRNLLPYDEFYYKDTRKQKILIDTETGETIEWKSEDKERLDLFLARYPQVKVKSIPKQTIKMAIVINNKVMYDGANTLGIDRYPFVPVIGYWDPDNIYFQWRMQGMVRGLRDPQFLFNRRKVIELDILESQINSGMKVMEGALVDDNDVLKAGQGQPIFIKSTAPWGMESVQQIQSPIIPPTTIQLSEILAKEMQAISGVNEELLGSAEDDKAGILSMLRQGAGLTTLQKLFDQLDLSQKILGQLTVETIQQNWTVGKVQRILGKTPTEQFFNKAFQKFDSNVSEGLLTDSQNKQEFIQYTQLKEMGLPIPDSIMIDKAPVQGKKELKAAIEELNRAQAQMEQQAAQLQMESLATENQTKQAFSEAQMSLAQERIAKVQTERAESQERLERADQEKTNSLLNLVKSLKELDEMDLNNLMKKISILKTLSSKEEEITNEKNQNEVPSQEAPQEGL